MGKWDVNEDELYQRGVAATTTVINRIISESNEEQSYFHWHASQAPLKKTPEY